MLRFLSAALILWLTPALSSAQADADWPGLWGATRTAVARGQLPAAPSGLDVLWRRPVNGGYSEVVVAEGRAFTMELRDGDDFIVAIDADSGREHWRVRVGPTYKGHNSSDDGPISTPAVEGNDLFALGPHGHLVAVDVATGKERWRHDLVDAHGAAAPSWGFAASPLIEGRLVVVPTGGESSQGLLAFDRMTGALVWNAAVARQLAYASATAGTFDGVRQIITIAPDRAFAVSPTDGRVLWSVAGPGGRIETRNTPVVVPGNRVLLTHWEQAIMLRISGGGDTATATEVWRSPRLRSAHGPTVYLDGFLYGFAGPQLICVNADTGEVLWRERTGTGMVIAVGNQLVVLGETGEIQIGLASPAGFTAALRSPVLQEDVRAFTGPSFSNGRIYVRNLQEIVAFRLR